MKRKILITFVMLAAGLGALLVYEWSEEIFQNTTLFLHFHAPAFVTSAVSFLGVEGMKGHRHGRCDRGGGRLPSAERTPIPCSFSLSVSPPASHDGADALLYFFVLSLVKGIFLGILYHAVCSRADESQHTHPSKRSLGGAPTAKEIPINRRIRTGLIVAVGFSFTVLVTWGERWFPFLRQFCLARRFDYPRNILSVTYRFFGAPTGRGMLEFGIQHSHIQCAAWPVSEGLEASPEATGSVALMNITGSPFNSGRVPQLIRDFRMSGR